MTERAPPLRPARDRVLLPRGDPARPARARLLPHVRERLRRRVGRALDARDGQRLQADADHHGDRGAAEHDLRDRLRARDRAPPLPRQGPRQRLRRPAARALAGRRRAVALPALRPRRLVRQLARRPRDPGALLAPGDGDRDDLRLAAVRRARGRADAARDRRRAGAGGAHARRLAWQTFWRITLPAIRWAVIYGVILTTARCLGEYGAVAVVSGRLQGETETATLRVEERYQSLDLAGAYAISIVLALIAVLVLVAMTLIRPKEEAA